MKGMIVDNREDGKGLARPSETGSRERGQKVVPALAGFDPARVSIKVGGETLNAAALRAGVQAMRPGKGVDYFEAWDVVSALLPACRRRHLNASYVADRLMQRARKAGYIRHRGRGQWERCDSDTHPQDGDVQQAPLVSGAGPQDIAHG